MVLVKLSPRRAGQQDHLVLRHGEQPVVVGPRGQEEVALLVGEDGRPVGPVGRVVGVHEALGLQEAQLEAEEEAEGEQVRLLHPEIRLG